MAVEIAINGTSRVFVNESVGHTPKHQLPRDVGLAGKDFYVTKRYF